MVRFDAVVSARFGGGDGWNPSDDVVCHAGNCYGPSHRSRHPRTTGAATSPVWNDLLTNWGCRGMCALLR
jgi:hypothetical protein